MENRKELWAETAQITLLTLGLIIASVKLREQLKQYKEWLNFSNEQLNKTIKVYEKLQKKRMKMNHREFNEGLRTSAIAFGVAIIAFFSREMWRMREMEREVCKKNKKLDELSEKILNQKGSE